MKSKIILLSLIFSVFFASCRKDKDDPKPSGEILEITSPEFDGKLLFVTKNNYQISTSEPATFSSSNPKIKITSAGLVQRLTSGEVAEITVTAAANPSHKMKVYAFGATDDQHDQPYHGYHDYGNSSTNPYSDYKKGWETLQKMPATNETYALVLRHADANDGKDQTTSKEPEWWKSADNKLVRQLNKQGRDKSVELGAIFKDLQFPIARVYSSEFRRAVETAELIDMEPPIITDGRLNHPSYNKSGVSLFTGMTQVVKEQPLDNKMTLISAHHPMNELKNVVDPNFPKVMAFTWTGGYFVKVSPEKTLTFEGCVSFAMFKYWRDLKLGKL